MRALILFRLLGSVMYEPQIARGRSLIQRRGVRLLGAPHLQAYSVGGALCVFRKEALVDTENDCATCDGLEIWKALSQSPQTPPGVFGALFQNVARCCIEGGSVLRHAFRMAVLVQNPVWGGSFM